MEYTLDANAAKQADQLFARIDEKGQYLGAFTRAEPRTSNSGTEGVDLSFKANNGATADYLTLWTHNSDGKQLPGYNVLMAIMTCLQVRDLKAEVGEIEKYDQDAKQRAKVKVPLFKALMNKPIGLLIHMEEYEKTAGGTAWKPAISAPFNSEGFTASEILSRAKEPATLEKMAAALRDRPLKNKPASVSSSDAPRTGGSFEDLVDDIPF